MAVSRSWLFHTPSLALAAIGTCAIQRHVRYPRIAGARWTALTQVDCRRTTAMRLSKMPAESAFARREGEAAICRLASCSGNLHLPNRAKSGKNASSGAMHIVR
jgi:hypothetical protein